MITIISLLEDEHIHWILSSIITVIAIKESKIAKAPGLDKASSVLLVYRCSSHIGQPHLDI